MQKVRLWQRIRLSPSINYIASQIGRYHILVHIFNRYRPIDRFLADRTAIQYDRLFPSSRRLSVSPSVCNVVHCGSQGRCTGLKVVLAISHKTQRKILLFTDFVNFGQSRLSGLNLVAFIINSTFPVESDRSWHPSEEKPIKISGKVAVGIVRDSRQFPWHSCIRRIARSSLR